MKWIKVVPTRNAINTVIIKLVTDNAQAFKSTKMNNFFQNHNIILTHSTPYYPQGNGLDKSSNKNMVRIIKKMMSENKRIWDTQLIYVLWEDMVSSKKSIRSSPFQLVYDIDVVIPLQLALPVMKFTQDEIEEPNPIQRRMLQLIETHQIREALMDKDQKYKTKVKVVFDKRDNQQMFQENDLVL